MATTRPKLKLELQSFDLILEAAAVLALAMLIALPLIHWNSLPETIPTHFNIKGEADDFGSKATLLLLPGIGLAIWAGFLVMCRFPHTFNYLVKITPENAGYQYQLAVRLLRVLKVIILAMFAFLVFATIQTAKGKATGMGAGILLFQIPLLATLVFYLFQSAKKTAR